MVPHYRANGQPVKLRLSLPPARPAGWLRFIGAGGWESFYGAPQWPPACAGGEKRSKVSAGDAAKLRFQTALDPVRVTSGGQCVFGHGNYRGCPCTMAACVSFERTPPPARPWWCQRTLAAGAALEGLASPTRPAGWRPFWGVGRAASRDVDSGGQRSLAAGGAPPKAANAEAWGSATERGICYNWPCALYSGIHSAHPDRARARAPGAPP